jgi:hypothetical protein
MCLVLLQLSDLSVVLMLQLRVLPVVLMLQLSAVPVVLMLQLSACSIVSSLCFSLSDLDADVQDLLQNPDTDHRGRLAFRIRKSYSSPAACDKCIQTDLQPVSMFRDVGTDKDWPVRRVGDSASVRV